MFGQLLGRLFGVGTVKEKFYVLACLHQVPAATGCLRGEVEYVLIVQKQALAGGYYTLYSDMPEDVAEELYKSLWLRPLDEWHKYRVNINTFGDSRIVYVQDPT